MWPWSNGMTFACHLGNQGSIPLRSFWFCKIVRHFFAVIFKQKLLKNGNYFKKLIINEISNFCRQYQYLQLEKPSGVKVEIFINKTIAIDLLKDIAKTITIKHSIFEKEVIFTSGLKLPMHWHNLWNHTCNFLCR